MVAKLSDLPKGSHPRVWEASWLHQGSSSCYKLLYFMHRSCSVWRSGLSLPALYSFRVLVIDDWLDQFEFSFIRAGSLVKNSFQFTPIYGFSSEVFLIYWLGLAYSQSLSTSGIRSVKESSHQQQWELFHWKLHFHSRIQVYSSYPLSHLFSLTTLLSRSSTH